MQRINSNFIENILEQEGKIDLLEAFKVMVGCNEGKMFNSLSEEAYKYNDADSEYYQYRKILLDKKDEVLEIASKYDLNCEPLYNSFSSNGISIKVLQWAQDSSKH